MATQMQPRVNVKLTRMRPSSYTPNRSMGASRECVFFRSFFAAGLKRTSVFGLNRYQAVAAGNRTQLSFAHTLSQNWRHGIACRHGERLFEISGLRSPGGQFRNCRNKIRGRRRYRLVRNVVGGHTQLCGYGQSGALALRHVSRWITGG